MAFLRGALEASDAVKECLAKAGVKTPVDFLLADLEALAHEGCSYRELEALKKVLWAQHVALPVAGDALYREALKTSFVFSTSYPKMDAALEGGVLRGEVVEICGGPGTGKSLFCTRMAVRLAASGRRVLYVDTAAVLTPAVVVRQLQDLGEEVTEEILQRVSVCRPPDTWALVGRVTDALTSDAAPHLLVIDALTVFMLSSSTAEMGSIWQLSSAVRTLANKRRCAVLLVMHQHDLPAGNVLRRMWQHVPHIRIVFTADPDTGTSFRIVKATRLAEWSDSKPL
ncbi:DNA repair protein RAD51 homolog 4 isoform X2 [Hyalella azteca]|uniref:DNA repair protein RAD51 homolog 4 isoform X2 n=1 Tax=Hyalella azteca TaxID=294128 RepID=A0A8B7NFG3_HYAAZ|nr:DNA repair protein RAD51 homolog 4 isoform X2 [Hyalella azteca]